MSGSLHGPRFRWFKTRASLNHSLNSADPGSAVPLVDTAGGNVHGPAGQRPGMVRGLRVAVHPALHVLEGMPGHLRREARRPVGPPGRGPLLAGPHALEEQVERVDLLHTQEREAVAQEPVLLTVVGGRPELAERVPGLVDLEGVPREHLDGPVHADVAVVQVEAFLRVLAVEGRLIRQEQGPQPAGHKHRVWIDLHSPIRLQRILVGGDLQPKPQEDLRVAGRPRILRIRARDHLGSEATVDHVRLCRGVLQLRAESEADVAVDGPAVAAEQPELTLGVLRAEQLHLVGVRQAHGRAEENWEDAFGVDHCLGQGGRRVCRPRGVDPIVEVLAATLVGQRVVRLVAHPLIDAVASLPSEDPVALSCLI
mmetsp:Transcript_74236/g.188410  ORF Transcript_74236/g.188410 Transcript_74236/m.188410 type:complete len:368 (-) Transcript_74236:524-1627(-)